MLAVKARIDLTDSRLIGPNCPGVITPGAARSASCRRTFTCPARWRRLALGHADYEAVKQTTDMGFGQSTCVGIGGDPIPASSFVDILELFQSDADTEAIVMVGEIGGTAGGGSGRIHRRQRDKARGGLYRGGYRAAGQAMGHAGAIIAGGKGTAEEKLAALDAAGVRTVRSLADIGAALAEITGWAGRDV